MKPPVVGNGGTGDPKQPGAQTARVTLEIETTHHFEKDLRCQVLGLLAIFHLARDEAVDPAKVFLVKCLKIPCIHLFHSLSSSLPGISTSIRMMERRERLPSTRTSSDKSIEGYSGEVSVHQMACHFNSLH